MKYKLLIFDFDGTLADTFPWVLGIMDQVADHYKFGRLTGKEVELLRGSGAGKILKDHRIPLWRVPFITQHVRRLMAQNAGQIHAFPGVEAVLEQLSGAGLHLALVTSNARENVRKILGSRSLSLFQDAAYGVSIFGKRTRYRSILRRSKLPA